MTESGDGIGDGGVATVGVVTTGAGGGDGATGVVAVRAGVWSRLTI